MTKKLILITVAALGLLYSEASLAKVCRLGDLSCDTNGFYGVGEGECDSSYKTCANPRAGATFCYAGDEAKYKDNDCCSTLVANEGYQECSIDDALVGYGKSCKGAADNITYWQYCGCSYGFVEVDGTNDPDDKALLDGNGDPIVNLDGNLVPYEARCAWDSKLYGGKCRFSQCNTDRRFFFENTGEYCKYRQETRCGGFGCMQVYDCNHDELNTGKEYYRNDSAQLAGGWDNFIPYLSEDQMTNEKDASGTVQLIKALNTTGNGLVTEDYNLTNKIVCSYAQSDGSGNDTGNGLNCNDVPNYCYLWTGCNNVRKWYSNHVNEGVIYDSEEAYLKWMEIVENQKGYNYSAQYVKNNPYHDAFYADVNPGYGTYTKNGNTYDAVNNSSCIKGIGCRITSANNGCTYITTNCHQDDAQHQCWKKISCSEENRFYSSFINASNVDNKTGKQELYLSSLNAPYWDEFYTGLQDKEIYPACLYEINECNDASGCYKKIGCETNFEDIRDHEDLENDWYPWFGDIRALCNDATRCYRATSCEPSVGAYSSRPNTSFFVTISSTATGLTCFRGQECYLATGSYTSVPNTSFFVTINSYASGSTCYRGQNCYIAGGAYSSSPNTSFFITISSSATGSTAYRGEESHIAAGAYSSKPNTSFFITISSLASGSTSYRGESTNPAAGAYTSTPNTSFFYVISSSASGSTAYRGQESHIAAGAYSSHPNTSFFNTSHSIASGSTCYRGESCRVNAGAYVSSPNSQFFDVITSYATGITCYRSQNCALGRGAYSSYPNTSFFNTSHSIGSGSRCYRGESCRTNAGAYVSSPNSQFFDVITSSATGRSCYRGQNCAFSRGAYTFSPNTNFFHTSSSLASGSRCYRAESCVYNPNQYIFNRVNSISTGKTCYRASTCRADTVANNNKPHDQYFNTTTSSSNSVTCKYATSEKCTNSNTTRFTYTPVSTDVTSNGGTITAYYPSGCRGNGYACSDTPGSYFTSASYTTTSTSGCGHSQTCYIPNNGHCNYSNSCSSYFNCDDDSWCGLTCYKSTSCNNNNDYYSESQQSSYFNYTKVATADNGTICYKANSCVIDGYNSSGCVSTHFKNTSINAGSQGNASNCCTVRGEPKDSCFVTSTNEQLKYYSYDNGKTCCETTSYKITGCKGNGSYNNSYVSNSITYNYRVGSTPKAKNYRYGEAFKEKTTRSEGISCNSYANCYIGCSCASGWTQGTAPSSGEYVWATDNRYTGVNSLSVGSGLNASGTIDAQSASSGISASGLSADSGAGISAKSSGSGNYSVSTMGTSGGMTCYKKACDSGYYLDAPDSTAFKSTSTTGAAGLTCYKATGCKDGYTSTGKGEKYSWHGMNCNRETIYYLCRTSYTQTALQKESSSSLECPANTIVVGRYHKGDENKNSQLRCGTFSAYYSENGDVGTCSGERVYGVTITVEDAYWDEWKNERNGYFQAPYGYVIVGRAHSGDENGQTRYKYGKVYVSNGTTKKAVLMYDLVIDGPFKESNGANGYGWAAKNGGYMMVGRQHTGDENGKTRVYYKRAKVDLY